MMEFSIIKKPVHWFALQISGIDLLCKSVELICSANQWNSFYMIKISAMKVLQALQNRKKVLFRPLSNVYNEAIDSR